MAIVAALSASIILATPSVAGADVAITVPAVVNLGAAPTGAGKLSAQLGTVKVTATGVVGLLASFTATVSSTNFSTGTGTTAETVPKTSVSYWSGPMTASSGDQAAVPGQLTALQALSLSGPRTAFASSGTVLTITASWNPTIVVSIPAAAVAGSYTGTITHSVA